MEKYLKNKTIMSVAGIVFGLILMIWRGQFVEQMIRVAGYILLAAAAVYLVMYFKNNRQNEAQMGYAVVAAGAGLLMILLSRTLLRVFPVIAGVVMIVSAAATLLRTYKDSNVPNMLCSIGISELRPIIRRLEEGKTKAYLGVSGIDVTQEISEANEIPLGVWVTRVEEDSPAMAAGIQKGDVITGVGKNDILTMAGLTIQLTQTEPGETVTLRIMRRNGGSFEEIKVSVTAQ